jgi:hypothetical protein
MTTHTQEALLDKDTIELIKAGFLTEDLKITDSLRHYLDHLTFMEYKTKVIERAKTKNKEAEKEQK